MSRINTNVESFIANTNLSKSQGALNQSLERLSSGVRINHGSDDPAGLIASDRLKSEIAGVTQAIDNSTRASNVISTAEGALAEVSNLLLSIQSLVVSSANSGALSPDEIKANQLQVDSAIASITRISNTTNFAGLKLLDGSLGYVTSGVRTSAVHDLSIQNAQFGTATTVPVVVDVITSAKTADLKFGTSAIAKSVSIEVAGATGVNTLSFVSGTTASAIAFAINRTADATGVIASATLSTSGHAQGFVLKSNGYGSKQFVSVNVLGGNPFATTDLGGNARSRVTGQDAVASINGAQAIADGLNLSLNGPTLSLSFNLDAKFGIGTQKFDITSGGAKFQLGAQVNSNEQVNIAIDSVSASRLGDAADGYLTDMTTGGNASLVGGNAGRASRILQQAIGQVSFIRGRLGAFEKNTINTNINSLQVALENVTAANSSILDTNFASETSNLTRSQILVQAGTSVLAQANQAPQSVLKLLG